MRRAQCRRYASALTWLTLTQGTDRRMIDHAARGKSAGAADDDGACREPDHPDPGIDRVLQVEDLHGEQPARKRGAERRERA